MAQLRQDYQKFKEKGAEVLVVGPEDAVEFRKYWETNQLPFTGLPDPQHDVLKQYGQEFRLLKMGRLPAQAVIDMQGMIRYAHYGESMMDIPTSEEILGVIHELNRESAPSP